MCHPARAVAARQGHWSGPHPAKQQTIIAPNFSLTSGLPPRNPAVLRTSVVQLLLPQGRVTLRGNALSETLSKIHYDPQDPGQACKIPIQVFRALLELCGRSGHRHVILSTDELKLNYGNAFSIQQDR